jgi:beta-lactamase class D
LSCGVKSPSNVLVSPSKNAKEDSIQVVVALNEYFNKYGVKGNITLYDNNKGIFITNDSVDMRAMYYPASTFKIINLLIALETGVIRDINEIIKWQGNIPDTTRYGLRPSIYHDMSVKEAFTVSAGWAFADLAKRIGRDKYVYYLKACNYGNAAYLGEGVDFWNFGPLQISPLNQVQFLKRLYEGAVPFSQKNIEILKELMVTEKTMEYVIHSKTGWSKQEDKELGWWTGYLEKEGKVYFFATRITQPSKNSSSFDNKFGKSRKEITFQIFKDLKII